MAISAVVAVGDVADELVAKIADRIGGLTVGDGRERRRHGPADHRARTATRWRRISTPASQAGATLVVDGRDARVRRRRRRASGWARRSSTTSRPTWTLYTDEIFGPVLSVVRVDDATTTRSRS